MSLAAFLVGLVGPIMARWIASMGLSLITVTGFAVAVGQLKTVVTTQLSGVGADALALAGLFGCWEMIGMVFGTMTFVVTWHAMSGSWALAKV